MMVLNGQVLNSGRVEGKAVVLDIPFSFIGDFDPETGKITIRDHKLEGENIGKKILVYPFGKGGTIAPFIVYEAKERGNAPSAIICREAEPLVALCAISIDIPIVHRFDKDPVKCINTGNTVTVNGNNGTVKVQKNKI